MRRRVLGGLLSAFLVSGATLSAPASASHSFTDPAFDARQTYPLQAAAGGTAIGDVNSDGLADVVVGTTWSFSDDHDYLVLVYLQRVNGTLDQPYSVHLSVEDANPDSSVDMGDLDGDGANDVAVTTADGIDVLYQEGGVLDEPVSLPLAGAVHAEIGDVDGDDDLDIVASTTEDGIFVLSNDAGTFTSEPISDLIADEIELADLNGDGLPELVAQRPGDNLTVGSLEVLTNDGGGGFTSDAYPLPQHVTGMGIGDVTGDSLGDVVIAFEKPLAESAVSVFEQQEDGTFSAPETETELVAVSRPRGVELGDANGDGLLDVFVGTIHEGVSVLLQTPTGGLMRPCWRHAGDVEGSKSLAVGDINSDERVDAVVVGDIAGLRVLKQVDPQPQITLEVPYEQVNVGESFEIQGLFSVEGGCSPGHETAISITREGPSGSVVIPATATQYGPISFTDTVPAPGDYTYTASFAGEGDLPAVEGEPIEVPAKHSVPVTISADSSTVVYGFPITLTGHLGATDVTNNVLEIENYPCACLPLGSGPVDDFGDFVFENIQTDWPRAYQAHWEGDENNWPATSEPLWVKVRIRLDHALLEANDVVGGVAVYDDKQNPKYGVAALPLSDGYVKATIQKRGRLDWKTIEQRPHVLVGGEAVFGLRGLEPGRYRVRSHAEKQFGYLSNTSPWLHFKVQADS